MHRRIARAFVNLGYKEDDLPILLESVEGNDDEQNDTETEDDPRISQEDLERIKPSKQWSSYRLLWLAIITCLILTVSLLVGLLIISEKIGRRCGCSEQNGAQHHKSQLTKKDFLGENETSISDLLEYLSSTMVKVEAAVDETKNDIAKLNRTTSTVENLNSSMNEVKAAVDGAKNDIAKLNRTTTTVENLNSAMNEVKAAVDGTKNDIAKLNRTTAMVENLNSAMNEVKAAVDGTKNDIAKLNRTTTMVENFNSAMNEVKAAVDGTKNDIAKLNRTTTMVKPTLDRTSKDITDLKSRVTKVKSKSDRTSDDVSVLNCTVTKLDKAIKSNLSESCQNVTWNSAFEDCKLKCCCSANSCEETPPAAESCKELFNTNGSDVNKAYPLKLGKKTVPVYCHMTTLDGCGGGGWTLVMKMDGSKDTFHYNHVIWTSKLVYNPFSGSTGFDGHETMLPTYWETKFNRICLGMKSGNKVNFIAINMTASSLYSLIADGKYRQTSLNRDKWKSLLPSRASLQSYCNREGFNAFCTAFGAQQPKARIGILANEQNTCHSCDSRIGFGTGGHPHYSNSCGNVAVHGWGPDNGGQNIKTMGYILVQ